MIKLCRVLILVMIITALALPQVFADAKNLPTIELKDAKLRGTVISGVFKPIAIMEHKSTNTNCWYKIGDTLCGGRIVDIQRGAIVLDMNGNRYIFGLPAGQMEATIETAVPGVVANIPLGKKVGDNIWNLELNSAIELLTKAAGIMREARIKPYFAIGKAAGIRVDRIKNESVIRKMGLEDGDVIKGINGFGLMTPTRIFQAYRKYKNNRLIQVQLIRDDKPITLTYNIVR